MGIKYYVEDVKLITVDQEASGWHQKHQEDNRFVTGIKQYYEYIRLFFRLGACITKKTPDIPMGSQHHHVDNRLTPVDDVVSHSQLITENYQVIRLATGKQAVSDLPWSRLGGCHNQKGPWFISEDQVVWEGHQCLHWVRNIIRLVSRDQTLPDLRFTSKDQALPGGPQTYGVRQTY